MIIATKDFKATCATILMATDTSELSTLTETLELKTIGNILYLNTTNKEYYCSVKFTLDHAEDFHAAVNANLFLKLIAGITSETIELIVCDTYLNVKANGNYKIPLIFENTELMQVPEITIDNVTVEQDIPGTILDSIVTYNTKQLAIGSAATPVQKMFYFDEEGCITFTTGACVNNFSLSTPVRVIFNLRLVSLFKLFKGKTVHFKLGYDPISTTIIKTKVSFETPDIILTAITGCDDSLLRDVPVEKIRERANKDYPNKVVLNVAAIAEAINRLLLFSAGYGSKVNLKPYSLFEFGTDSVTIYDTAKENIEVLQYQNGTLLTEACNITLDLSEFKKVLDSCNEQYITMNFGDGRACSIARNAIKYVLPLCKA